MKKLILIIGLVVINALILTGCKKTEGGADDPGIKGKTYKFTITSSNVQSYDLIDITFSGGSPTSAQTVFKVDGVMQDNQQNIKLTKEQVTKAGGVVVESAVPLILCRLGLGGFSALDGHTFIVKVVPLVDGAAGTTVTKTFTTDVFYQSYNY